MGTPSQRDELNQTPRMFGEGRRRVCDFLILAKEICCPFCFFQFCVLSSLVPLLL